MNLLIIFVHKMKQNQASKKKGTNHERKSGHTIA